MHWLKLYLSTSLLGGAATCAPWRGDQFLGHPKVLLITHHEQRVTWPRCSQNAIRRHWSREYGSPEQAGGSALIQYVLKAFLHDPEEIPKTERKKNKREGQRHQTSPKISYWLSTGQITESQGLATSGVMKEKMLYTLLFLEITCRWFFM